MTHYQFTNSDAEDAAKCPPKATLEASHARVQAAVTGFLNAALDPSGDQLGETALRAVDGAEVSVR
jgi:hypothetical protein